MCTNDIFGIFKQLRTEYTSMYNSEIIRFYWGIITFFFRMLSANINAIRTVPQACDVEKEMWRKLIIRVSVIIQINILANVEIC